MTDTGTYMFKSEDGLYSFGSSMKQELTIAGIPLSDTTQPMDSLTGI